jgi:hypothetical protein
VAAVTDAPAPRPDAGDPTPTGAPATLRWAVGLLAAQAVGVAAAAAFLGYEDVTAPATDRGSAAAVTGYVAVMAALLALLAWALWRRRGWARGPAVVLELLQVPIGYYMTVGGLAWLGLPVLLAAAVTAGLLVAPATRAALGVH